MGLTAFNLRQFDARLGRWQTPDPYGQHHSPYLAMSNNPVSFTDPDGGLDEDFSSREYHDQSKAEMDAWNDQMRQAENPEYYTDLLVGGRLANGQLLNMDALIGETMARYFQRHPIASVEFDERPAQVSPHTPESEDEATYQLGWEIQDRPADRRDVVREYWKNFSSKERQEELIKLARTDDRVATWIVNNPKFSNEMRGLALVARSDDFSKAVHTLMTMIIPMPAVGAASTGGRMFMMAGRSARASTFATSRLAPTLKLLGTARDNLLRSSRNPRLKNAIDNLYRPNAKLGSGSSMDALRIEGSHLEKVLTRRTQLHRILRQEKLNAGDKRIVRDLLIDIQDALNKHIGAP